MSAFSFFFSPCSDRASNNAAARVASVFAALGVGVAFVGVGAKSAQAQVTTYTSAASFNAAATTDNLFTFENIAAPGGFVQNPALPPLTITVTSDSYRVIDSAYSSGVFSLNGTDSLRTGVSADGEATTTTFNLGSAKTAFATEIGATSPTGANTTPLATFSIQLFNGATAVGSPYSTGLINQGYVGFTSTQVFDRVVATNTANGTQTNYATFDNLRLASVTVAVPEPGTLACLAARAWLRSSLWSLADAAQTAPRKRK